MALRFPINSGSWSNSAIWSGSLIPTSVDDVHANNRAVLIDQNVTVLSLRTTSSGSAAAGGVFNLLGNYTVTVLDSGSGFVAGTTGVISYDGTGSARLNGVVRASTTTGVNTVNKSGAGFLTISGSIIMVGSNGLARGVVTSGSAGRIDISGSNRYVPGVSNGYTDRSILVTAGPESGTNTVNIIGDIGPGQGGLVCTANGSGTASVSIVGNVYDANPGFGNGALNLNSGTTPGGRVNLDINGNLAQTVANASICISNTPSGGGPVFLFMTLTGSAITSTGASNGGCLYLAANGGTSGINTIDITGSLIANGPSPVIVAATPAIYLTVKDGIIQTNGTAPPAISTNPSSVGNITLKNCIVSASVFNSAVSCSGFITDVTLDGCRLINGRQQPGTSKVAVLANSMYVTPNSNTRWTMWDPTQTSQYTMYAQGFVPDSPIPSDVRFGTAYLGGTLSGSMVVPNSGSVLFGVQVDNGTGSYSVTADQISEAVWNKAVTTLTGSNSIGQRLANSSTVSSTGAQIAAFGI